MNGSKFFNSQITLGPKFAVAVPNEDIKDEPMFFNCDYDYAMAYGGQITRHFLTALPEGWHSDIVFDSRVHMLMPGWYPAIPGFHHDDVPRPTIPVGQHFATAGQPDYDTPRYLSEHILGTVNADICPTEFALGGCVMPDVAPDDLVYRTWHPIVEELVNTGKLASIKAPDRQLVYFDCHTFHQATQAVGSGWRWFGRVTRKSDRTSTVTNEIRRQVQVYLEKPMEGW